MAGKTKTKSMLGYIVVSGGATIILGGGDLKRGTKHAKICHFYAKIVKFELILTHLKLFGVNGGGQENIFLRKYPMPPCGTATDGCVQYCSKESCKKTLPKKSLNGLIQHKCEKFKT